MNNKFNPLIIYSKIYGETLPDKGARLGREAMEEFNKQAMEKIRSKKE